MGSIIRFARPRPRIRLAQRISAEREAREARRSVLILTSSFLATAMVMCAAVVVAVSSTWTDVIVMSAFVLVFALLKIVLANVLMYVMMQYDTEAVQAPAEIASVATYRRTTPARHIPGGRSRLAAVKTGTLRLATGTPRQGSPGD